MQRLISETFEAARVPANWQFDTEYQVRLPVTSFERGGLRSGQTTVFWIPLPGHGWNSLRVELDIEPVGGAVVECGDGATRATLCVKGGDYPRHTIRKYRHRLGESLGKVPDRPGVRRLVFEFNRGRVRGFVDGQEYLAATDPFPRPFVGWLSLGLFNDLIVRRVEVFGSAPCSAIRLPARKTSDFFLEVNVDFADDLTRTPFTKRMFDELFAEFTSWGVKRCHWIHYGEKEAGWWDAATETADENAARTFENVGRIFPTAVQAAHAHGVELYGLLKPFDMGLKHSYGEGTMEARTRGRVRRIGGPIGWIARFPAEHPEYLMARKPCAHGKAVNDRFTAIDLVKEDDRTCAFAVSDIALYVSDDNTTYRPYKGPVRRSEIVEDYPVYEHTASGGRRTGQTRRCRVMRLDGLELREKYFALAVPSRAGSFVNSLVNLIHVFGEKGEERLITLGYSPRMPWSNKQNDFREAGIEFDFDNDTPTAVFAGYDRIREPFCLDAGAGVLAAARGKERSPLAHLSPAFRESREWWLSLMREMLEAGADGVELRVRNHHSDLAWGEYGFETPVVEEFMKRYGVDLHATDDFDRAAFRRLRGEFYTQFYREARQLVDAYGKRLGLHVSVTHDMEPEQGAAMEIHWDWRTWLREGLADSVTMKEVRPGTWVAQEILSLTRPRGIPVVYCPYSNTCWHAATDAQAVEQFAADPVRQPSNVQRVLDRIHNARAGGYDGFQFYECASVVRATKEERIVMEQPALRDALRKEFAS